MPHARGEVRDSPSAGGCRHLGNIALTWWRAGGRSGSIAPAMRASYANGPSTTPLLGETIGDNLGPHRGAVPRSRGAVVAPPGRAPHLRASSVEEVDRVARALIAAGLRARATASGSGRRTAPSGSSSSTRPRRSARSSSTSTRPTARPSSSTRSTSPAAGCSSPRAAFKTLGLRRDGRGGPADAARRSSASCCSTRRTGTALLDGARRACARTSSRSARRSCSSTTRSTSSTRAARPASPRARRSRHHNILNNGYFVGAAAGYTEEDRVCIPVPFYHCFGMVMGNLACDVARRVHGRARRRRSSRRAVLEAVAGGALHVALRRADDVHRRARPPGLRRLDLSSLRTGIMAGSPCPVEVMKRVIDRDAHGAR